MTEFLQQLLNGLSLGAIYALIALGYTMVYGVLRFINFAHADVFMVGAFAGYYLGQFLPEDTLWGGSIVLIGAMATPGTLAARWISRRFTAEFHNGIFDVAIVAGGVVLLWQAVND